MFFIFNQKLKIEEKFAYFSLIYIFINIYKPYNSLIVLLPFILLLYIPYLKQDPIKFDFVKENKIMLIGLSSIFGICFMIPNTETIIKYLPKFQEFPWIMILYLRWIILLIIMVSSLIILSLKSKSNLKIVD